jgi:glucokinase
VRTIGVDVGGSGVRAAWRAPEADEGVGPIHRHRWAAPDADAVVAGIVDAVLALGGDAPDAVGVGVPGYVRGGVVRGSPNLPDLEDVDLARRLREALGVPVVVENDANAAAWGAWTARGQRESLVLLTLGTGVGGGIVSEGRLVRGAGAGGEVGHLPIGGDRACGCGATGCLEQWVGTVGLVAAARARGLDVRDGADVVALARAGDAAATDVLDEAAWALGRGLRAFANLFDPDVIVIAGGLAAAADLLGSAEAILRAEAVRAVRDRVAVVWGGRADAWAILGAAELARAAVEGARG